jgi:hypothetical protein
VQIGGVKTTANPSDILTKFLPAPTHQEHSKYLNLHQPKPYTQNGNFIRAHDNKAKRNSPKRSSQRGIPGLRDIDISTSQDGIRRKLLSSDTYQTKRHKQKQRQKYWDNIHKLRQQNPHLSINPKQTLTSSVTAKKLQRPILRFATETKQTFHRQNTHPRRTQVSTLAHKSPIDRHDPALIHANREHAKLQVRRSQQPIQHHHVRMTTANHDLQTTKAFNNKQQQRIKKWIGKLTHTRTTHDAPTRCTHPFCHHHQDPSHASTSCTPCKYKKTIYTKTPSTRKQEIRTKMTDRQTTYNFSPTQPKQTRPKLFDPQHRSQHDKHKRHPKFNRQPHAPISFKSTSRPFPRAPSKNDEVKKGTRGEILNKSTNQHVLIPGKQKLRQNAFSTNQDFFNTTRQMFESPNPRSTSHLIFDKQSNHNLSSSTIKIDLYNKNHTDNVFIVKQKQKRRRRGKRVQDPHKDPRLCPTAPKVSPPPPTPHHHSREQQSQRNITHAKDPLCTMRLERHELRRHSIRSVPSALSNDGTDHHTQRLRNILDAQSDVLDALNAMTKIHIDKTAECMDILYDLYTDALLFSHRGKTLAPASHNKYHCYYMVFKDLEEIIHRQYSKAQREHRKIASLNCPYCDLPVDYFRSPPPDYNPPKRTLKDKRSRSRSVSRSPQQGSPQSPRYLPTGDASSSSSSSSSDGIPPPPKMPAPSTHVALLNLNDNDNIHDLQLQHLDIR